MKVTDLSNEALVAGLIELVGTERRCIAATLAHLIEVEERRLHLEAASPSLYDFCTRKLGMSESSAVRRIMAVRIARCFPVVLDRIANGKLHLSALVLLRNHLTKENHEALLDEVAGMSKRDLEQLLAARAPKPDVPTTIQKLPAQAALTTHLETSPTAVGSLLSTEPSSQPKSVVQPLSADRYKVQLTASAELREKIERSTELMRHQNPTGDLATVLERALDLLIGDLEKKRFGKTSRPRARKDEPQVSAEISNATRREVAARDEERCTFVCANGERCPARAFLEYDHRRPRARGGLGNAANICLLCRAHNQYAAEQVLGRAHIDRKIHLRRGRCGVEAPREAKADVTTTASVAPSSKLTQTFEVTEIGLVKLGFQPREVQRVVGQLRLNASPSASASDLLRAALALLTADILVTRTRSAPPPGD